MPPQKGNDKPPETMTWGKAAPHIIIAALFDALRFFFTYLIFLGPAFAGVVCAVTVNGVLQKYTVGLLGAKTAALACGASATVVGFVGAAPIESFGLIMADIVGLIGFLVLGLWILMRNTRLFKEAASGPLLFVGSFALSEVPFLGSLPFFSVVLWRLYSAQIKIEQVALKKWHADNDARLKLDREQKVAQIQQARMAQQAAGEALYAQEAANEAQYTQEMPEAA